MYYWYLTKVNKCPENRRVAIKVVREGCVVVALTVEADKSMVEYYQLTFLGAGSFDG